MVSKWLLKTDMSDISQKLNSYFCFFLIFFVILSEDDMTNGVYCIVYVVCLGLALIECRLNRGKKEHEILRFSLLKCKTVIPGVIMYISTVLLRIPLELYSNNSSEFTVPFWNYFFALLCGSLVMLIVIPVATSFFLTEKHLSVFSALFLGLVLTGYIQGMFFNGEMNVLDGSGQEWSILSRVVNTVFWIVSVCIIIYLFLKNEKSRKMLNLLCIYFGLIQIVSVAFMIVTVEKDEVSNTKALTTEGMLEVSSQKNVFVFILDRFDGEFFDTIYESEGEFLEPLKDFTYFNNATCQFAHTDMAIPYMLTGVDWTEGMDAEMYKDFAFRQSDVLELIRQEGYNLAIYSDLELIGNDEAKMFLNYSENVERKCDVKSTIDFMTKCSKYSISPIITKSYYEYYSGDIDNMIVNTDIWNISDDLPFYYSLIQNGLSLNEIENSKGTVHFYHMNGAHPPFDTTEDLRRVGDFETGGVSQSKGALNIVYEYMEQLKALGKYDDSLIIITADHGIQMDNEEIKKNGKADRTSIPIVLVKNAYEYNEMLKVNGAPISQAELLPTIISAIGIEPSQYGRTFSEVQENEKRERSYIDVWNDYINRFVIHGNSKVIENWVLEE